jgi:predicted Zn-dependent protease
MSASDKLNAFLQMLDTGQDGPLLRYSIGLEHLHADQAAEAIPHLRACLEQDPGYSAAYKVLAQAQDRLGEDEACRDTLVTGIARAGEKGDLQAKKEMEVFLRRLDKGKPLRGG